KLGGPVLPSVIMASPKIKNSLPRPLKWFLISLGPTFTGQKSQKLSECFRNGHPSGQVCGPHCTPCVAFVALCVSQLVATPVHLCHLVGEDLSSLL
ncbi:hypothetical protein DSO57_1022277, partial [Entomophthora muscae]